MASDSDDSDAPKRKGKRRVVRRNKAKGGDEENFLTNESNK
jgi:hypothetical protein